MPVTEYAGWIAFFSIYPFSEDRQDVRTAELITTIRNMSGRTLIATETMQENLTDYLGVIDRNQLSLEKQAAADRAFGEKLRKAQNA